MTWFSETLSLGRAIVARSRGVARWMKGRALSPTLSVAVALAEALRLNLATDLARMKRSVDRGLSAEALSKEADAKKRVADAFVRAAEARTAMAQARKAEADASKAEVAVAKDVLGVVKSLKPEQLDENEQRAAREAVRDALQTLRLRGGELFVDPEELRKIMKATPEED